MLNLYFGHIRLNKNSIKINFTWFFLFFNMAIKKLRLICEWHLWSTLYFFLIMLYITLLKYMEAILCSWIGKHNIINMSNMSNMSILPQINLIIRCNHSQNSRFFGLLVWLVGWCVCVCVSMGRSGLHFI